MAISNKTFNEIRVLELFRDIERAPKLKYGQVCYLETEFSESFEDGLMSQSENDICINGLTAQTERTGQQQQGILKCIQDLQGQVNRQQEQITSLMESVLKLCSPAGGQNVTNGQMFGNNANKGPPKCFQCGEPDHFKAQCPLAIFFSTNEDCHPPIFQPIIWRVF